MSLVSNRDFMGAAQATSLADASELASVARPHPRRWPGDPRLGIGEVFVNASWATRATGNPMFPRCAAEPSSATIPPSVARGDTQAMTTRQQSEPGAGAIEVAALAAVAMSPHLRELAGRGSMRRYRKGTVLIEEGDRGDTLYIIMSGRLRAFSSAANGREITFGIYGPGEYLGELSLDGGPRSASVSTLEPSLCSVVTRATLDRFIEERPAFAFELLAKVIRRARAATLSAKNLALNSVYGSLKQMLELAARPMPDGTLGIDERLTHQDIANRLGCSREMVSRVMKDLETGGYLVHAQGRLVIVHPLPVRW